MKRTDFVWKMIQVLARRRNALRRTLDGELALLGRNRELFPVGDLCDEAQDAADDEVFARLAQSETRELLEIEYALARIRDGLYGKCAACHVTIPVARLRALPYATLCIQCQGKTEKTSRGEHPADALGRLVNQNVDEIQRASLNALNL